jgi:signal transduction histidine kinase
MMQSQADTKEVRINFDGLDIEADSYMIDVQRSMQVLINLISNATKFSHKHGEIYVIMTKASSKENHTTLGI